MTRRLHFCGSLPPELTTTDNLTTMQWFVEHRHGHDLLAVPTRQDPNWIIQWLRAIGDNTDVFEIARPGDYADYDDFRSYRVRRGVTLRPEHVSHGDVDQTIAQVQEFQAFRAQTPGLEGSKLLLPVPFPVDLALFAFAGGTAQRMVPSLAETARALRYLPVFSQATVDYVTNVSDQYGDDVLWHLEAPSVLIGMDKAVVPGGSALAAGYLSKQMADLLARFPKRAGVILHLCYGDYNHRAVFTPKSLEPAVTFLNRLAARLRERGVAFPPAHIPAAYGEQPPSQDPGFYQPLHKLDADWQIIPGVVAAGEEPGSLTALRLFEAAAGREAVAVACACGLGRVSVDTAEQATEVMAAAAKAPSSLE